MASNPMDRWPTIPDLEARARKRLPFFAWEYVNSGTGLELGLDRNTDALSRITFRPELLKGAMAPDTTTTLFGVEYAAPIGIAPVGLSNLIWPGGDFALAAAAASRGIPHVLSTVATESPEVIGPVSKGMGWFQLYPPNDPDMRDDLIERVRDSGFTALVVTGDVPFPSRRERQRKAHIRIPPKIGPQIVSEVARHPAWARQFVKYGPPKFKGLAKYADRNSMADVAGFVAWTLGGTLSWDYLAEVRERWDGPLIVKGILDPEDAQRCVDTGADAVQVSNHGARQLDGAIAAIEAMPAIMERIGNDVPVLFDSGIRDGLDVARAIAYGASFVFCGRAFMYALGAIGSEGPGHAFDILQEGLVNVMYQTGCNSLDELADRLTPA